MAYVLLAALRRIALAHTRLARATCGSIRFKLLKIGAQVRVSTRRIRIAMASGSPCQPYERLEGVTFWGSPWQPWFFDMAFNLERGAELREKWDLIPAHVDVPSTHGPPQYLLDRGETGENAGCEELRDATERTCPRLHVFGHIHHGHGCRRLGSTLHVNVSNCAVHQEPLNPASVVDLPADGDTAVATKVP